MEDAHLLDLKQVFEKDCANIDDISLFDALKSRYLGPKSVLRSQLQGLGKLKGAEKAAAGRALNAVRQEFESKLKEIKLQLERNKVEQELKSARIDTTLFVSAFESGSAHPITLMFEKVHTLLARCGFSVAQGPELETSYYNFTALNTPENHPATTMQDTFYLHNDRLLRSHTSTVQVRMMERCEPPLSVYSVGRVFRADTPDATHSPCFHQCEGLIVDTQTSLQDLVDMLSFFLEGLFDRPLKMRFRPSYFPFTEPSLECDIFFNGKWMEVLGCGLVHPNVLQTSEIDAKRFKGFAFGVGIERLAMLYYGVEDIRLFYEGDLSFLEQFQGSGEY